jgi:citrate lyase subunit alpha/citrate CoA-transferase
MTASMYGNPHNRGAVVNNLDVMILGATEVDLGFNVNVTTGSTGFIMGGSGGHSDTAAGAKLAIIVTQLVKSRLPIIVESVTTVTTPGETVDVVVTERGIAVNPDRTDLIENLKNTGLPVMTIEELKNIADEIAGKPEKIELGEDIAAVVEYRDGTIIDVVKTVKV